MKTKTINVYQYSELEGKAKERAKNWLMEADDMQFEWDDMKEDAKTIGIKLTGVDDYKAEGELLLDFSQVLASILKEHGETCETYKTAKQYKKEYDKLTEEEVQDGKDEDIREEFLKAILEDYRILWRNQVEYHYSDEYINETMEANEYEFDENGKRV